MAKFTRSSEKLFFRARERAFLFTQNISERKAVSRAQALFKYSTLSVSVMKSRIGNSDKFELAHHGALCTNISGPSPRNTADV